MWVHDLRHADASCGGKAAHLARLIAAGLPVPPGFVLDDRAFRAVAGVIDVAGIDDVGHALEAAAARIAAATIPEPIARDVIARARALGPLIVRSSATIEDGAAGAAAGVFSSLPSDPEHVWDAIRAVWASALTPLAAAYARRRGGAIAIGVIVQARVAGERVTIYTRRPGEPARDELIVQRGDALERRARDPHELAVRAEVAIAAPGGADVELVGAHVVQARPIVHPPPAPARVAPPPSVLASLQDGGVWTWDVAHNPDPLSVAQQGLVERVAEVGAWSLRVVAGYLYAAPREHEQPRVTGDLVTRAHAIEARLADVLADPPLELAAAIDRYIAFYRIWAGELAPVISAARAQLTAVGHRPSAVESALAAAARGERPAEEVERELATYAPAWDVAAPTFGEQPGMIRAAIARATAIPAPQVSLASPAADLAERDDALFGRAQWMVRRALLARASERGLMGDDIFWLPLDDTSPPDDARRRAAAARSAAARAARWDMPFVVGAPLEPAQALRGVGSGPRVTGRVVRFASLASAIAAGPGDVVVTRAVTPALAIFVVGCAALVSETGGLLDHGAALARELGIPCVVGCHGAWAQLRDGTPILVDGARGIVQPLEETQSSS